MITSKELMEKAGFSPPKQEAGRKNIYQCQRCFHVMVTIDRDAGVTPFITMCPVESCGGPSQSKVYQVHQSIVPTHEWYRPEFADGYSEDMLRHIAMGGLLLRKIQRQNNWSC